MGLQVVQGQHCEKEFNVTSQHRQQLVVGFFCELVEVSEQFLAGLVPTSIELLQLLNRKNGLSLVSLWLELG